MKNFLKGIVIGLGAIAPGLSGSVLLVMFGLYQKTIDAISTIFKHFVKNLKFLIPLGLGMVSGAILFSKIVKFMLGNFEMQTRFLFLGLIVGSIPLFWREVRKEGFSKKYYIPIVIAFAVGIFLFQFNRNLFPQVVDPNFFQSVILGLVVAASYIVPGVDSAAILTALGMYEVWNNAIADLNFAVLIPAAVGLGIGVLAVSFVINLLIKKCYTLTFSIIFGLFLSVVPSVIDESCVLGLNGKTAVSVVLLVVGVVASLLFSNLEQIKEKISK